MKHIVIGPGAMSYFVFMGTLSALTDKGALNDLETISGSSAGALLGFMYILTQGNVQELFRESIDIPVHTVMKPSIKSLFRSYGLVSSKKILTVLSSLTRKFSSHEHPTFKELYEHYPVKFYVSSCCVELSTTHYFSVDTHPNMSVHEALTMSIALPFLLQSVKYQEWHYIDGAMLEETPCGAILHKDPSDVHVIRVNTYTGPTHVKDLQTYGFQVLWTASMLRHKYRHFSGTCIDMDDMDVFDFTMALDSKVKMFVKGYMSCTISQFQSEIGHLQTLSEQQMPCQSHPEQMCDAASDQSRTSQAPQDEPMIHPL